MSCKTCGHTMQNVGENGGLPTFWCPRCGTLKMRGAVPEFESPTNKHLWPVYNTKATPDLLAVCKFLMARCQDEGLDVVNGPYDAEFKRAHEVIAKGESA